MDQNLIEIVLWLVGGGVAVISSLLSWIAFMIREDKLQNKKNYEMHDKKFEKNDKQHTKYDKKFNKQHSEIKQTQNEIKSLIEVLRPRTG